MTTGLELIDGAMQALTEHGITLQDKLLPAGQSLTMSLAFLLLSWGGVKLILEGGSLVEGLGEMLNKFFMIGLVWWLVSSGHEIWVNGLLASFTEIGNTLSGAGSNPLHQALAELTTMIENMWASIKLSPDAGVLTSAGLQLFFTGLTGGIFKLVAIGFITVAAAIFVAMYAVSQVLIGIALALGPVFIPWLLLDATNFVFWGWLKFLIVAALYKVVGLVVLSYGAAMMTWLTQATVAASLTGDGANVNIVGSIVVVLLSFVLAYLMFQIPVIANGLMAGHASVSVGRPPTAQSAPVAAASKPSVPPSPPPPPPPPPAPPPSVPR